MYDLPPRWRLSLILVKLGPAHTSSARIPVSTQFEVDALGVPNHFSWVCWALLQQYGTFPYCEWYADDILTSKKKWRGLGPSTKPGLTRPMQTKTIQNMLWPEIVSRNWNRLSAWVTAPKQLVVISAALLTKRECTHASTRCKWPFRPWLLKKREYKTPSAYHSF